MTNDTRQILPFDSAWPSVANALQHHSSLVLVAEPGAGKTTRLPARIIAEKISNRVAVLEPRRIAARAAASRIVSEWSSELGWKLGGEVGYSVRFDHRMTDATRLQFFTEGLFLKRLASNPTLQGIDCVVLDEFHERSRYTDLALALLKELQFLERPDLRIIVMSATMDAQKVADFLSPDTPIIHVPGRTFPIDVRHSGEPLSLVADRAWIDRVVRLVRSVANGTNPRIGDILTFLPGVGEIRRVEEALLADAGLARACRVLQLHGSLSLEEQNSVLVPSANDPRPRIILSTNIAETSLTLDGVGTVIDTGLARVSRSDRLGFSRLHLERISLASARQRAGRAGRQAPGICYRLWSKADELSFSEFDEAELSRIDLADSLLDLYALGVPDPRQFEWFESPDRSRIERSLELLRTLGAIDSNSRLTTLGRAMHQTG
ncbi:MAG: helicase-related protein, partial [Bdellovibrionales bacterium]|nr:helicase-related protein [Bdellovibrionales bacterium]